MFVIPKDIHEKLKCGECKEVVSSSPLYSKKTGENYCGKCKTTKEQRKNLFRNFLFEDIAESLLFPCKYEEKGCQIKLRWGKIENHEENCEFGKKELINCPSLPSQKCRWEGSLNELVDHYKTEHKDFLVSHPYELKAYQNWIVNDMKRLCKSSRKDFLMEAHGYLFLLKFKVCFQSDNLWVCVSFLGEPKLVPHFQSYIEFSNDRDIFHNKVYTVNVIPHALVFDEKCSLKIALHENFKISINKSPVKCTKCKKTFETIPSDVKKYCCENFDFISCAEPVPKKALTCIHKEHGCSYIGSKENIFKHSFVLCCYVKDGPCILCKKDIEFGTSFFQHLKSHVSHEFKHPVLIERNEVIALQHFGKWEVSNGSFLINWGTAIHELVLHDFLRLNREIVFFLKIFSDFPSEIEKKLLIAFTFVNKLTGFCFSKTLKPSKIDHDIGLPIKFVEQGWYIQFPIETFSDLVSYKIGISLINGLD